VESAAQIMREVDRAKRPLAKSPAMIQAERESEDEAMWKERAEKAEAEVKRLGEELRKLNLRFEEAIPSVGAHGTPAKPLHQTELPKLEAPPNGWPVEVETLYALFCQRLEAIGVLNLSAAVPEINVSVKRRTITMNDETTDGRIALLISEKFFDVPQDSSTVAKEFRRRGWLSVKTNNVPVLEPLKKITAMGFLFLEGTKYLAVPGMKVNILEAPENG
jgi:hypothetical protein